MKVAALCAFFLLPSCAPATVTGCSVRLNDRHQLIATATIANRSAKVIVESTVLIAVHRPQPSENRLFASSSPIAAWSTKTLRATAVDPQAYDFKAYAPNGCELERLVYADKSFWEEPSPL